MTGDVAEPGIEIGRLALRAPWLDAEQGRVLAHRVADGLAAAAAPDADVAADSLAVSVAARTGENVDELSERIVAALMQELRLSS